MVATTNFLILVGIAFLFLGIIVGWLLTREQKTFTKTDLRILIAILVTMIWAMSIIAEILIVTYTVSVLTHGIMGAVVGYLFSEEGITFNIGGE